MNRRKLLLGASALAMFAEDAMARLHHGSVGSGGPPPTLTITGISLAGSSFLGGSPSGTAVGTITVAVTGGSFSGSLSLTGANAASFQIVGTSLQTNGIVAIGSYSINIVATQGGAVGSPFVQAETITAGDGSATIAGAMFPTTKVLGGDYVPLSLRWTGTAPASITSATWSGGGGSATVYAGSFVVTGGTVQCMVSTPSPGSTTSYNLSLIADNGASCTLSGISVIPPIVDMAPGLHGPTTAYYEDTRCLIASYFSRGLPGPLSASIADTVFGSGDSKYFHLVSVAGATGDPSTIGGICPGINIGTTLYQISRGQTCEITLTVTNGINSQSLPITVIRSDPNCVGAAQNYTWFWFDQVLTDMSPPDKDTPLYCQTLHLLAGGGSLTFTPDSGGLFSMRFGGGAGSDTVQILKSDMIPANYGRHTFQVQTPGGPLQTTEVWLIGTRPPTVAWQPNVTIYSSTPATTGFTGSNLIGTLAAFSDERGLLGSELFRYEILSDSSGVLQVWNTGEVYLTGPVSVGTIDAQIRITSRNNNHVVLITLSLPVLAGTTLASSNITPTISGSLTNFVPYANSQNQTQPSPPVTTFPYGPPVTVGTFTVSGFTHPIIWSDVQLSLPLGPTFDTAQVLNGGDPTYGNAWSLKTFNLPRYIVTGSGTSATITATNLSATNKNTAQVDTLRIQLRDAFGTYCTRDVPITVNWHTPTVPLVTVGPGGTFADQNAMGIAFWNDFNANSGAAIYAGTTIMPLPGFDPSTHWYGPGGGGGSTDGRMPFPVAWVNDTSTQWSGNGTISGTALTINSTSAGAIKAGDYIISGVGSSKVMIMSGSGASWTVHIGPDPISLTASIGPAAMTTKTPRANIDFTHHGSTGSAQGGMYKDFYDMDFRGLEIHGASNAYGDFGFVGPNFVNPNASVAGIYCYADASNGNVWIEDCYIHGCDVGIFHGGIGNRITMKNSVIAQCGNGAGNLHTTYFDYLSQLTIDNCQLIDTLGGNGLKLRATQAFITNCVIGDGINANGGGSPVNYTLGGNMQFVGNIVTKNLNDHIPRNGISHTFANEINGANQDSTGWTYPYQNNLVDSCQYWNLIPTGVVPFQDPQVFSTTGSLIVQTTGGPVLWGMYLDPVRNTSIAATVTNSVFGGFNIAGGTGPAWCTSGFNADPAIYGSGNSTTTIYPASAMRLIDPVTGTPPFRLPHGPWGYWYGYGHGVASGTSTIASSPGYYYRSLTVPAGSPSGTDVIGGLLSGYDANFAVLSSPVYTFNNDFVTDNALFSITTVGSGIQLKTASALANGLYLVTLQCVGTGWSLYGGASIDTITSITSFRVIVGNYI